MKFVLEHKLPRRLRYAKMYFEAGPTSVLFTLDGTTADWHASIGHTKEGAALSDRQYSRLRASLPAVETIDDNGEVVVVRNSEGAEEQWRKPRWVLLSMRKGALRRGEPEGTSQDRAKPDARA